MNVLPTVVPVWVRGVASSRDARTGALSEWRGPASRK